MKYLNLENLKTIIAECQKNFAGIKHKHTTSDVTGLDETLKNVANIVYTTRDEYDQLEKNGALDSNTTYVTTDGSDNITDSSVQLWNTSSSLAQQGKYLSYSDQNGGKYLSLMNSSDNTAVAHAKLMDGESGEGMDVDADKVKTVDSKGILVEALGETTAQALIDEVAKRVLDLSKETTNLTGRMTTVEESITSLNSELSWKSFANGVSSVDISSLSWKAIHVFIIVNSNNYVTFSIPLVYPLVRASGNEFRFYNFGMYFNSGTYVGGRIGVSIQRIYIDSVLLNGQEVKESSHMWVSYR